MQNKKAVYVRIDLETLQVISNLAQEQSRTKSSLISYLLKKSIQNIKNDP